MLRRYTLVLGFALSLLATACGGSNGGGGNGSPDAADPNIPDADPNAPDADPTRPDADPNAPDAAPCTPGTTQCSNCLDDDRDGTIDGADAECAGAVDNDEGTFSTGISGDNNDPGKQDCFFDGNSGGNPQLECIWHTCCLLDNPATNDNNPDTDADNECPANLRGAGGNYRQDNREASCPTTGVCADLDSSCQALTPPGCDCFGCCTVCKDNDCKDVYLNLSTAPDCSYENLNACLTCYKTTLCGGAECNDDPTDCVLCPGQDESDLPSTCSGDVECPSGLTECVTNDQCSSTQYCANGCCIATPVD